MPYLMDNDHDGTAANVIEVHVCPDCGIVYSGDDCPLVEQLFDEHWALDVAKDEYVRIHSATGR